MTSFADVADEIRGECALPQHEPRHELVELGRVKDYLFPVDEPATVGVGDTITIVRPVSGVDEKQDKHGRISFMRAEVSYTNQHGTRVALDRLNTLRCAW